METVSSNHLYAYKGLGGVQRPNFDILTIVKSAHKDIEKLKTIEEIKVIDLPAGTWTYGTKKGNAPTREHPILWEHGGYRTDGPDSMCTIIGDSNGGFVPFSNVRHAMHGKTDKQGRPHANGQHAMFEICEEMMLAIGHRHMTNWTILVYRIKDISQLTADEIRAIYELKDGAKVNPMARLTCELVGWHVKTWNSKNINNPPETERLIELTREKLTQASYGPIGAELWRRLDDRGTSLGVFDSEVFTSGAYKNEVQKIAHPKDFLTTVGQALKLYRTTVLGMSHGNPEGVDPNIGNYVLRVQQDLFLDTDDNPGMRMVIVNKAFGPKTEYPLGLDQLGPTDVRVFSTVFTTELPFKILDREPSLFHGCNTVQELHDYIAKKIKDTKGWVGDMHTQYLTNM